MVLVAAGWESETSCLSYLSDTHWIEHEEIEDEVEMDVFAQRKSGFGSKMVSSSFAECTPSSLRENLEALPEHDATAIASFVVDLVGC